MSTFDYVNEWYKLNEELVNQTVTDKNHILTSEYGHKKGAYLVSVELTDKNILIPMYAGEAGADDDHDRSIADRLKEHLRHWLGTYTTYYTGVRKKDLLDGKIGQYVRRNIVENGKIDGYVEDIKARKTDPYSVVGQIMESMLK